MVCRSNLRSDTPAQCRAGKMPLEFTYCIALPELNDDMVQPEECISGVESRGIVQKNAFVSE